MRPPGYLAFPNCLLLNSSLTSPTRANGQILNFGMSDNFQKVDFANLPFPAEYLIDYVRVYQRPGIGVMGCDPADHPTAQYIADHANAYANPNLTTWAQAGYEFPVRLTPFLLD
jgi:hypothetical protein